MGWLGQAWDSVSDLMGGGQSQAPQQQPEATTGWQDTYGNAATQEAVGQAQAGESSWFEEMAGGFGETMGGWWQTAKDAMGMGGGGGGGGDEPVSVPYQPPSAEDEERYEQQAREREEIDSQVAAWKQEKAAYDAEYQDQVKEWEQKQEKVDQWVRLWKKGVINEDRPPDPGPRPPYNPPAPPVNKYGVPMA